VQHCSSPEFALFKEMHQRHELIVKSRTPRSRNPRAILGSVDLSASNGGTGCLGGRRGSLAR
jgi:hypothetical protein